MAAGTFSRRSQQARRAAACIQCAERLFWCAVWVWFGIRTFRLAHRIFVCRKFSRADSGDELVYNKTLGDWRTHNGVDYACEPDALVTSPAAGTVMQTGQDGSWGSVVSIEDSAGRIWRVCGVTGLDVAEGDTVSVGQQLGKAGTVSCECAEDSHIHLEVKQGNQYLDPAKVMD